MGCGPMLASSFVTFVPTLRSGCKHLANPSASLRSNPRLTDVRSGRKKAPENRCIPTLRPGSATARFSDYALIGMLCYCDFNILIYIGIFGVAAEVFVERWHIGNGRKVFKRCFDSLRRCACRCFCHFLFVQKVTKKDPANGHPSLAE